MSIISYIWPFLACYGRPFPSFLLFIGVPIKHPPYLFGWKSNYLRIGRDRGRGIGREAEAGGAIAIEQGRDRSGGVDVHILKIKNIFYIKKCKLQYSCSFNGETSTEVIQRGNQREPKIQ